MKEDLSTNEVAQLARVSPRTVGKWCDSGLLTCWRIPHFISGCGDQRRIERQALLAFARQHGIPHLLQALDTGPVLVVGPTTPLVDWPADYVLCDEVEVGFLAPQARAVVLYLGEVSRRACALLLPRLLALDLLVVGLVPEDGGDWSQTPLERLHAQLQLPCHGDHIDQLINLALAARLKSNRVKKT